MTPRAQVSRDGPTDPRKRNSLGLSKRDLNMVLDALDAQGQGNSKHRKYVRWAFRVEAIDLEVKQPGGNWTKFTAVTRNLSFCGASVLHSAYVHPGSACRLTLPHPLQGPVSVAGKIVRCRHVQGMVHELGVQFDGEINAREYVDLAPLADYFALDHVDPQLLQGKIVHVEDSELDQRIVQHFLRDTQVAIRTAGTIEQALPMIKEHCDLVLADYHLPDGTADDLIMALRSEDVSTPVIVATSDTSNQTRDKLSRVRASAFIAKPMTDHTLRRAIGEFLLFDQQSSPGESGGGESNELLVEAFMSDLRDKTKVLREHMEKENAMGCYLICMQVQGSAPAAGFDSLAQTAKRAGAALAGSMSVRESLTALNALVDACGRLKGRAA